ncbi:MAG: ATPase, T2SS/T4P/T4SS family, partial [Candidatus Korarchaeota archaeon]|nr:ATPase, T2SS/T4P/T4SS family [Candidatus Korarchaeota archaeon]
MGILRGKKDLDLGWARPALVPEGAVPIADGAFRVVIPPPSRGEPGEYVLYEPPRPPGEVWNRAREAFEEGVLSGLPPADAIEAAVERAIPWKRGLLGRGPRDPPDEVLRAREALRYHLRRDILGLGPLTPLLLDQFLEDVALPLTGDRHVYVYSGDWYRTNIMLSVRESEALARRLGERLGKQLTAAHPVAEGILSLGGQTVRIHALLNPEGRGGATIHIRMYRRKPSLKELVYLGMLSPSIAAYLKLATVHGIPAVIFGRVGAGKTTLLNAVLLEIPRSRHLVVVEDTPELWFPEGTNFTRLLGRVSPEDPGTQPTIEELVRSVLRMRPDYIVVGEARGREAVVLAQYVRLGASG